MSPEKGGTVFVVDDDHRLLKALSRLLRCEGFEVQPFFSPSTFLEQHDPEVPGCAILDVELQVSGLVVQEILASSALPRPVIFLTGCDDVHVGVAAMKSGAVDYLTKPFNNEELFDAVRRALKLDRAMRDQHRIMREYRELYETLSPRERDVLEHLLTGQLNKQIAHQIGTVEKTVKVHRSRILRKMQVHSVAALVHMIDTLRFAEGFKFR